MISSKPSDRPFLDHDQVEDVDGRIYVVIGNVHPPDRVMAYVKYVPVSGEDTPWARGSVRYYRVVKMYGVRNVMPAVVGIQDYVWDPVLNAKVPTVKLADIAKHYLPELRLREIIRRADDELEMEVLEVIDRVRECCNVPSANLGVSGSLLPKIHNVEISDIDLLVYGCKEACDVAESVSQCFESPPKEVLASRLVTKAKAYGLSLNAVKLIAPPYRMLYLRNREINICFVSREVSRYGQDVLIPLGKAEVVAEIEGGECRSLFYPSIARISRVTDVIKASGVSREVLRANLRYVISYEGIFSYAMYRGGMVRVAGIVEKVRPGDYFVILLGGIEYPGYLLPYASSP